MARELARLVPQDIEKRSPEAGGGFALVVGSGNTCPSDTTQCGGYNCCPNSLTCHSGVANTIAPSCCPASSSCLTALTSEPYCADSTWLLFYSLTAGDTSNFFCCQPGQLGLNDGSCASNLTQIASSLLASTVTPGAAAGATSATSATSGSSIVINSASTSSASLQGTSGTSPTSSTTALTSASSSAGHSGSISNEASKLSTGAKIGIGVGIGLGIMVGVLLLCLLVRIRSLQKKLHNKDVSAAIATRETSYGRNTGNAPTYSGPSVSGNYEKQVNPGYRAVEIDDRRLAAQLE